MTTATFHPLYTTGSRDLSDFRRVYSRGMRGVVVKGDGHGRVTGGQVDEQRRRDNASYTA